MSWKPNFGRSALGVVNSVLLFASACASSEYMKGRLPTEFQWPALEQNAIFDLEVLYPSATSTNTVELLAWKESVPERVSCPAVTDALVISRSREHDRIRVMCLLRYQKFGSGPWQHRIAPGVVPPTWAYACQEQRFDYARVLSFLRRATPMRSPYREKACDESNFTIRNFGLVGAAWVSLINRDPEPDKIRSLLLPIE